jgi:hypothetical protein
LGVGRTLELLDRLKSTVQDISLRATKLNQDFRAAIARETRTRELAAEEQAISLSAETGAAEAAAKAARDAAEARFEKRKTRIGKAYQASKEQALVNVEKQIGGRKYDLQKKVLQAEKDRAAALAQAATDLQEFKTNLAAEQETLAGLEHRAQIMLRGYRPLVRAFADAYPNAKLNPALDENQLLGEIRERLARARTGLGQFRRFLLLRLFKYLAFWVPLMLCIPVAVPVLEHFGIHSLTYPVAGGAAVAGVILLMVLRYLLCRSALPVGSAIANELAHSRLAHDTAAEKGEAHYHLNVENAHKDFKSTTQNADYQLKRTLGEAGDLRVAARLQSDERTVSITAKHNAIHTRKMDVLAGRHAEAMKTLQQSAAVRLRAIQESSAERERKLNEDFQTRWQALETEWKTTLTPLYAEFQNARTAAEGLFPPWTQRVLEAWTPPAQFAAAAKFAQLNVDLPKLCPAMSEDSRLVLPGPPRFTLPLSLAYPGQGSILFETAATGHDEAISALNNIMLRLLANSPPGRLNFTILDPVGLGQNFAGVMHLADYEEQLINNRIWTQSGQIEQKLADLNEHMEKVIQMYLRNEYATIAEYNEQAGVIAEKYHFLVVADFPANFTDAAAKRLLSIAASGGRCGVYMLLHWDRRLPLPQDFLPEELRKNCVRVTDQGNAVIVTGQPIPGSTLALDPPPTPEFATEFTHRVGRSSRDSSRVEVPFSHVAPPETEIWSTETASELRVPIGRTGATKFQYLAIGKGTRQHALVAGKTGSGKSTLFHVLITNLALWCSPEQVEFYLVDFKKGVEFKCYAASRLPHARVVAIESDREFGLSVLQRLDEELKRRGDLFRKLGVQDLAGYKREGGTEKLPRSLLVIDEFQEFFIEDDTISQTASMLLDRIVRQGRAFGIHVILGSQTLGGAYTVARTTLGQMVIRIALQCNEADAYLIMDDTNPAPRLLSRPGEGIYNDMAGALEGNSPFQTVWLPDEVRGEYLDKVRVLTDQKGLKYPGPVVFEGNAPADIAENPLLSELLAANSIQPGQPARIWLGAPNSIKGPTEAAFRRQSGNNMVLVGQRDEAILAILSTGLIALAAQYPVGAARFILCSTTPPGTPARDYLDRLLRTIPHPITQARPGDLGDVLKDLVTEMKTRSESADSEATPPVFLFIHDLQRYNKLRYEEEFGFSTPDPDAPPNPAILLNDLLSEGARNGIHIIASCDTYNNINRFLSRKAFSEFEMRVLFQMSANDSASLIDNPKASTLGLHRALFFYEQEGHLETFRPYALPGTEWLEKAASNLSRLLAKPGN